jgi:high frequency lysogenization protein
MHYSDNDRTMALAGIFQAAKLVYQISNTGSCVGQPFESILETLFKFDSHSVEDIYGDVIELRTGLNTLIEQMSGDNKKQDMEITRYVISIIHLEKKLGKKNNMLNKISSRLEKAKNQVEYFSLTHENILANIGGIYQDTISKLSPRIIVKGEQAYLTQQNNTNKIRSLLLAGIRSAVLWRQCGGNRLQFLLGRKKYIRIANSLVKRT